MCLKLCLLAISFRKVHNYSQSRWEDQSLAGFFIKALHTNRDKEPHNLLKTCLRPKAVDLVRLNLYVIWAQKFYRPHAKKVRFPMAYLLVLRKEGHKL